MFAKRMVGSPPQPQAKEMAQKVAEAAPAAARGEADILSVGEPPEPQGPEAAALAARPSRRAARRKELRNYSKYL